MTRKNRGRLSGGPTQNSPSPVQSQTATITVFKAEGYSGPLPPPQMLALYNDVFPGLAQRIVAMAERQAEHRQTLERGVILGNVKSESRGQWLGAAIVLACIIAGVFLIMYDKPTAGLVAILGPVATLAGVFLYGKRSQQQQLASKNLQIRE